MRCTCAAARPRWKSSSRTTASGAHEHMSDSDRFAGTMPVEERHRFDVGRLAGYLRERLGDFPGAMTVEQFKGGQSNPTFLLHAGDKRYVLRRKPMGRLLPSAHAVDREYRVITA